jgi:hypothetical protein
MATTEPCNEFRPGKSLPLNMCEFCGWDRYKHPIRQAWERAPVPTPVPIATTPEATDVPVPITAKAICANCRNAPSTVLAKHPTENYPVGMCQSCATKSAPPLPSEPSPEAVNAAIEQIESASAEEENH